MPGARRLQRTKKGMTPLSLSEAEALSGSKISLCLTDLRGITGCTGSVYPRIPRQFVVRAWWRTVDLSSGVPVISGHDWQEEVMKTERYAEQSAMYRRARICCAVGVAMASFGMSMAARADITNATSGPFTYICGGVAADEQAEMRSEAPNYDMGLLFTQGARGEYLSDVNVKLMRNGKEVAEFTASGPRCLIRGPRASYKVVATYEGMTKQATLSPGEKNVQIRW